MLEQYNQYIISYQQYDWTNIRHLACNNSLQSSTKVEHPYLHILITSLDGASWNSQVIDKPKCGHLHWLQQIQSKLATHPKRSTNTSVDSTLPSISL